MASSETCQPVSSFGFEAVAGKLEIIVAHELQYFSAYRRIVDIGFDALESIEDRCRALIDMPVSLGDIVDLRVGETAVLLHHDRVNTVVGHRIVRHDSIRRHIRADTGAALDQHELTQTRFLVDHHAARQNRAAVDMHIARYGHAVAHHTVVFYAGVMPHMTVGEHIAPRTDRSAPLRVYAAVDYHMLADYGIVADEAVRRISLPAEILRLGADYGALEHAHPLAEGRAPHHAGIRHYLAAVAYHDVGVYERERMDGHVIAYFGLGIDVG